MQNERINPDFQKIKPVRDQNEKKIKDFILLLIVKVAPAKLFKNA